MAIKVNGTTVINDSRALSNITSVDSTTKSAIETAGVGGGLKYLGETTLSSSASYIDYSFPTGYGFFRIAFGKLKNNNSQYSSDMMIRLKNSSGTLITSNSYARMQLKNSSINSNQNRWVPDVRLAITGSAQGANLVVDVYNPRDSNYCTVIRTHYMSYISWQTGYSATDFGESMVGSFQGEQDNNGIRFYPDYYSFNSGVNYKVWGGVDA
jgi:hypothetical protein